MTEATMQDAIMVGLIVAVGTLTTVAVKLHCMYSRVVLVCSVHHIRKRQVLAWGREWAMKAYAHSGVKWESSPSLDSIIDADMDDDEAIAEMRKGGNGRGGSGDSGKGAAQDAGAARDAAPSESEEVPTEAKAGSSGTFADLCEDAGDGKGAGDPGSTGRES